MGEGPRGWFVAAALEGRGAAVELQMLEVVRVQGGQLVLVLGEKHGARKLPLPVSKAEAEMIDRARSGPRGLLAASLDALGGTVLPSSPTPTSSTRPVSLPTISSDSARNLRRGVEDAPVERL